LISSLKSKRGSLLDMFWLLVVTFAFAIIVVVGWMVMGNVNAEFQSELNNAQAKTMMQDSSDRYVDLFDGIFLFVFFGTFLATLIGSLFLDTHPAFFIVSLLLLVILCVVAAVLANAYAELAVSDGLGTEASDFTFIPFIMEHLVHIIIFMVCSISIALYSKSRYG